MSKVPATTKPGDPRSDDQPVINPGRNDDAALVQSRHDKGNIIRDLKLFDAS